MKTELILVGKTVNKHFIAGIKDYAERITHYMPFNITTIPELKNTAHIIAHRIDDTSQAHPR
jgi:23S rRNA (pseudouridine1915-N3)-methyltransferase